MRKHVIAQTFPLYTTIDVRKHMKYNPSKSSGIKVPHTCNADTEICQRSLFNDIRFFNAVKEVTEFVVCTCIDEGIGDFMVPGDTDAGIRGMSRIIPVACTAGLHRADGTALCSQKLVLNRIQVNDNRQYNVNVFRLSEVRNIEEVLKSAQRWLKKPWTMCDGDENWAQNVCVSSNRATNVRKAIVELSNAFLCMPCIYIDPHMREMVQA